MKKQVYMPKLSERLERLIYIDNNYNAVMVGQKVGKDRKTIYSWINGNSLPSAFDIVRLATLFNVSTDYLLGVSDE